MSDVGMVQTLWGRFAGVVDSNPHQIAVREASREWSYAELHAYADAIAARLDEIDAGERVACLLSHGGEMVAGILGVLAGGRAYVSLDPMHPVERSMFVMADCGAETILCDGAHAALATQFAAGTRRVVRIDEAIAGGHPRLRPTPDSVSYLLYTSGSTGRPKGVLQVHANVLHFIDAYCHALEVSSADVLSLLSTFAFDAAVVDVFSALLTGATLCPFDMRQMGVAGLADMLERRGVTIYHSTPTVFRELVRLTPAISPRVRAAVLGGEEVLAEDVARFRAAFSPTAVLVNGYGMTECSWALINIVRPGDRIEGRSVPLGEPIAGVRVTIVPSLDDPELAAAGMGTIQIECAHITPGYWQRPEDSAAAFPRPRTYVTTDLGRALPDGRIEFAGRKAAQIKLRGYRIDAGEIESVLLEHPAVREAAVVLRDGPRGPDLVAYVVAVDPSMPASPAAVRAHLAIKLPFYMLPALVVTLAALPRGATGKLERRALPTPDAAAFARAAYVAPRTPEEESLATLWCELLDLEQVSVLDDFFALGGQSLLAARLVAHLRIQQGVELSVRDVFEHPTVEKLGLQLRSVRSRVALVRPSLGPSAVQRARMPPPQRGTFLVDRLSPTNRMNRLVRSVWLDGAVDVPSLERALDVLRARHEILRSRFFEEAGEQWQGVQDVTSSRILRHVDISTREPSQQEAEDIELTEQLVKQPYALADGETLRVLLVSYSPVRHRLTIAVHRVACDMESLQILEDELHLLWDAFATHVPPSLPAPTLRYIELSDYLQRLAHSEAGVAQRAYWLAQLDGAVPLELPTDLPRAFFDERRAVHGVYCTSRAAVTAGLLGREATAAVERVAREANASALSVLLAAMATHLTTCTGQRDLSIVSHFLYRHLPGFERTVGLFANPLVMRLFTSETLGFRDQVRRTHATVTAAYDHSDVDVIALAPHLFRLFFNYTRRSGASAAASPTLGLARTPSPVPGVHDAEIAYDLVLAVAHLPDRIELRLNYSRELFVEEGAVEFLRGYVATVERLCKA